MSRQNYSQKHSSCDYYNKPIYYPIVRDNFYLLDNQNNIISFRAPENGQEIICENNYVVNNRPIIGLLDGQQAVGIDFRPAINKLYLLARTQQIARLYILDIDDPCKIIATPVGSNLVTDTGIIIQLNGSSFGVDFNPVVDRLRVVSDTGQNLRINPTNGVTIIDGDLSFATNDVNSGTVPRVGGAAYTNSFAGTTTTTLYDIDTNQNILVTQNPPNEGILNTVGSLGINISEYLGFDIVGRTNTAFAVLRVSGNTGLYNINLSTGRATLLKHFIQCGQSNSQIIGLAILPI
ncbi:putative lipoprotein [Cotonvirus japonicus]|uniref:Lipoprotein n=1 Tax=Cotonvirus japonicus TaxID=2811091 RepID=A0ABM7NQZ7_9VIRU|nr:putative lipoprotein [Cotonvirus japonicus]BCS82564.1 putative lipoprotein [Cotonvirus japonicus]